MIMEVKIVPVYMIECKMAVSFQSFNMDDTSEEEVRRSHDHSTSEVNNNWRPSPHDHERHSKLQNVHWYCMIDDSLGDRKRNRK